MPQPGTSAAQNGGERRGTKRLVDADDTTLEIPDPKRSEIALNKPLKVKCLQLIIQAFEEMLSNLYQQANPGGVLPQADEYLAISWSINTSCNLMNIIFTCHNLRKQEARLAMSNLITNSKTTDFKVTMGDGGEVVFLRTEALEIWDRCVVAQGFSYKAQNDTDTEWIGTIGPFMDCFSGFSLRMAELRLGHKNFLDRKEGDTLVAFSVSKYGLSGAHHILLEGSTFPPEKRLSMAQSLGPMTAFICMLRSSDKDRNEYEGAVKRAMAHVPCIDDIIEVTRSQNRTTDTAPLCSLISDILLITTSGQENKMFFPINYLYVAYSRTPVEKKNEFLDFFNLTGSGGFYMYKVLCELELKKEAHFTFKTCMSSEMISQVVFHSIFGTDKEDLGILSQITLMKRWLTSEEMGQKFRAPNSQGNPVKVSVIPFNKYSEMSCANQSGLLTDKPPVAQVSTKPTYSDDFFQHLENRMTAGGTGKSIPQIISILSNTLSELLDLIRKNKGKLKMGTSAWRDWGTLGLGMHGDVLEGVSVESTGSMFMGRPTRA